MPDKAVWRVLWRNGDIVVKQNVDTRQLVVTGGGATAIFEVVKRTGIVRFVGASNEGDDV